MSASSYLLSRSLEIRVVYPASSPDLDGLYEDIFLARGLHVWC
jgi:hypothetical protein